MNFLGYFDWNRLDYRDFRYYQVKIDRFDAKSELVGREALIDKTTRERLSRRRVIVAGRAQNSEPQTTVICVPRELTVPSWLRARSLALRQPVARLRAGCARA